MNGCKLLQVDSIESFKSKIPYLEEEAIRKENFEDLYAYTFQFSLEIETVGILECFKYFTFVFKFIYDLFNCMSSLLFF